MLDLFQLFPEGSLLWPRVLCQHARGERAGARRTDEVRGYPLSVLHPAVPLHALPGEPGSVSGFLAWLSCVGDAAGSESWCLSARSPWTRRRWARTSGVSPMASVALVLKPQLVLPSSSNRDIKITPYPIVKAGEDNLLSVFIDTLVNLNRIYFN